jgi:hypothetical protein
MSKTFLVPVLDEYVVRFYFQDATILFKYFGTIPTYTDFGEFTDVPTFAIKNECYHALVKQLNASGYSLLMPIPVNEAMEIFNSVLQGYKNSQKS